MELTLSITQSDQVSVTCDGQFSHTFSLRGLLPEQASGQVMLKDPVDTGRRLFAALFLDGTMAHQALQARPRRILLVSEDAQLDSIPWEYLYGPRGFLVKDLAFVRGLPAEQRQKAPDLSNSPLHVVAIPSNPIAHDIPPLDIDGEWKRLGEIFDAVGKQTNTAITLERVRPPSLEQTRRLVANQCNRVVHFMGHGGRVGDQSLLIFENEFGLPKDISAEDFIRRLDDTVYLVTLNACVSAVPGKTEFSNVARALVENGIPYALGMRFSIPDQDAKAFSQTFYAELASGSGVENVLRQARLSLADSANPWAVGTPVLYTSLIEPASGFASQPGTPKVEEHQPRTDLVDLPRAPGAFQGRVDELLTLGKSLTGEPRRKLLTIQGSGGQGKTALAREAGERFAYAWPGGVWGISLESRPSRDYFCSRLGKFLGLPVDRIPDREDLERRILDRLNQQRTLIVLDNTETLLEGLRAKDPDALNLNTFLLDRLCGTSASLLVTSREPLGWAGEMVLPLEGLNPAEGAALFIQSAPQRLNEIDMDSARSLSVRVEGHPLALILLGQTFNDISDSMTLYLETHQVHLLNAKNRYKGEDHRHHTLNASIETSVRYLDDDLRRLLSGLWIFQGAFRSEDAADIFTPAGEEETEEQRDSRHGGISTQLQTLARRGLLVAELETLSVGDILLYRVLPTVRLFLKNNVPQRWEEAELQSRMGALYLEIIKLIVNEFDRIDLGTYLAGMCREDLIQCADWVEETGRGWYWNRLGWVLQRSGDQVAGLTWLGRALQWAQDRQDRYLELVVINNLGIIYHTTGQWQKALALFEQALPIHQEVGDQAGEAATLNGMGMVYQSTGQPEQALAMYEQALPILHALGNRAKEATMLINMGPIYRSTGKPEQALALYEQALLICREVRDRAGEAATLNGMGAVYQDTDQLEHALALYEQALPICREVGYRAGEATTLGNMGLVYWYISQPEQARALYEQALLIHREVGNRAGEATTLVNLALLLRDLGQDNQALIHLRQAVALEKQVHDPDYSEDAKTLAQWEAAAQRGEPLPKEQQTSSRLSREELGIIAANTVAVLTDMPEKLDQWREAITSTLQQAKQNDMTDEQAFFEAILVILAGQIPAISTDNPYAGVVAEILEALRQFSPPQPTGLPLGFAARWLARLIKWLRREKRPGQ